MKKTITIPEKIIKAQTKEIEVCDICEENEKDFRCQVCGRSVCIKCTVRDYTNSGDYPDCYCQKCYKLLEDEYFDKFVELDTEYEEKEALLYKELKDRSLK